MNWGLIPDIALNEHVSEELDRMLTTVDVMGYLKICRHCVASFHTRMGHTKNCLLYLRISDLPCFLWHQHDKCFAMSLYIFSMGFSSLCITKVYYLPTNVCGLDDSL